jgi:hypothetical protein
VYHFDIPVDGNFFEHGYTYENSLISEDDCNAVFDEMKKCWTTDSSDYIHSSKHRLHFSLPMTVTTVNIMAKVISFYRNVFDEFLCEEKMRWLVEFSSICVLPGARGQIIHKDIPTLENRLITVFVNLMDVSLDSGPLLIISGSQDVEDNNYSNSSKYLTMGDLRPMTLPKGSCVLMDSRLFHSGTANTSNSPRPVFYFTFGEQRLKGPTYSIKTEYSGKYKLDDFEIM